MNVPPNVRPFSLEMAQQSHPLVTRAGQEAKFIAYVPDVIAHHQLLVQINDEIVRYNINGKLGPYQDMDHWDLFLAPLGYCEGKSVFAGDILIGRIIKEEFTAVVGDNNFDGCKWPSKAPIVETRISRTELRDIYDYDVSLFDVANKAIERAISDGDVIPTSVVKNMLLSTHGDRNNTTCEHMAQIVIDQYLGGLK